MKYARWTQEKIDLVKKRSQDGLLIKDIAKELEISPHAASVTMRKYGIENTNSKGMMGKWNSKHSHMRRDVMEYFLNHTMPETMLKFRLTKSEFKSLMTVSYKMPELLHLRKDKRQNHRVMWTNTQIKRMLQMCGLRPREVIANEIGRGNARVIKEKLMHLKVQAPKYLNGLSLTLFRSYFQAEPSFFILTDAGPTNVIKSHRMSGNFKIIPWVYIQDLIENDEINPPDLLKNWVKAMSEFQDWFHDGNAYGNILDISLEIK